MFNAKLNGEIIVVTFLRKNKAQLLRRPFALLVSGLFFMSL
jgi:hypothetical protein